MQMHIYFALLTGRFVEEILDAELNQVYDILVTTQPEPGTEVTRVILIFLFAYLSKLFTDVKNKTGSKAQQCSYLENQDYNI